MVGKTLLQALCQAHRDSTGASPQLQQWGQPQSQGSVLPCAGCLLALAGLSETRGMQWDRGHEHLGALQTKEKRAEAEHLFCTSSEETDFFLCLVIYTRAFSSLLISSMLISPWEITTLNFQPGQSSLLLNSYFSGATRLGRGPGASLLQEKSLAEASFSNTISDMGKKQCREPAGFSYSNAAPTRKVSAVLDWRELAQGLEQGPPPSALSSAEKTVLALPR